MNTTIQKEINKNSIIDFHSHILPGIDDGAKTIEDSIAIVKKEIEQGVSVIVLTPHFYPDTDEYETFLEEREKAYRLLLERVRIENLDIKFILAAEVKFSPQILEMDLRPLCIENTDYILIEFSMIHYHGFTQNVFYHLQAQGFLPIIAHAERYVNMPTDELYNLVNTGVLVQVNTSSVTKNKDTIKKVEKFIKANLVHLWGTDTHSLEKRPPTFDLCEQFLEKKYGTKYFKQCMQYAQDVLQNNIPNTPEPSKIKKGLFW